MKINFSGDVKLHMIQSAFSSLLLCLVLLVSLSAYGADISGPEARLVNNEVVVTTGVVLDEKNLNELRQGVSKELVFHIDLFRVWKAWPDEFITGKKIVKTLLSDPIKKEYSGTSFDGTTIVERRFKSLDSLLTWALQVQDLRLINTKELELSDYFIRVTVESRLKKLPPVIGYLLFFVPEREFRLTGDSSPLTMGVAR